MEYLNWRLVFYINVPVGIINIFMSKMFLPTFKEKVTDKFDLPGFVTSVTGFFCLLYALSDAPNSGWTSLEIVVLFTASGILLSLFVVLELTSANPMLDLRIFKIYVFLISAIATSLISMAMLATLFVLPVFLQNGLGLTPLQAGLITMPGAVVTGILMPVSGELFDRIGIKPIALVGMSMMLIASVLFTGLNLEWSFFSIMVVYMIRQLGRD
ncbi:Major facilitator superfamily transporter [Acididesulfobacillus acetoxydans]|uniref:Drug resistance transporter, EmrB/QacA sub n=1 Tax=Acididesulfobacillus acetoxydans TaxID=1561005 RepID=A0A8S0X6K0_9FIRM|nr:MFS transporter [Acididesulfobacillus acetoxydans]CAA7602600.1 Major facilitator superfamily transporter [Acididesulfobacillus acetoxydans]CEJ07253.1 Drug resistance transporter, EmrB/QacA sub [Acididesulfobacillus acetoxydans]